MIFFTKKKIAFFMAVGFTQFMDKINSGKNYLIKSAFITYNFRKK